MKHQRKSKSGKPSGENECVSHSNNGNAVLVVEDDKKSRNLIVRLLKREGYAVVASETAERAFSEISLSGPDLLIMDIDMPNTQIDGVDAAIRIQRQHPVKSVIFVTAFWRYYKDYHQRAADGRLQVADWISKPLVAEQRLNLLQAVKKELKKIALKKQLLRAHWSGLDLEKTASLLNGLSRTDKTIDAGGILGEVVQELRELPNLEELEDIDLLASDAIGVLYQEIRELGAKVATQPRLKEEIEKRRKRLEQLQEEEAEEMRSLSREARILKRGTGYEALEMAKKRLQNADSSG